MTATQSYDWIKKIDNALLHLDEKPQFAIPSSFPLDAIARLLEKLFNHSKIQIDCQEKGWQKPAELFGGLGENLSVLTIEWTPLETPVHFVVSEMDLKALMGDLLGGEEAATPFFDPALAEGFFHYLAMEVLQKLEQARYLSPLSPRIGYAPLDIREELKTTNCFVSDVALDLGGKHIWGRLLVPEPFRKQLNAQMSNLPHLEMSDAQAEKIEVDLILEVAQSRLALDEWKSVSVGDFIVLDRCSFDPDTNKGRVTLKLGNEPIFRGRLKEDSIKLSEYPLVEEVEMEEEMSEGRDEETFSLEEDLNLEAPSSSVSGGFVSSKKQDVDTLPVHLTVEVGRLRMSVKELRKLAPGNTLELGVTPEQGVDLLVNGKKMGRGELIRMGETLGIRILSF